MPTAEGRPQTLYDKVFQDHIVDERLDGTILLYIGSFNKEKVFMVYADAVHRSSLGARGHFTCTFTESDPLHYEL